MTTTTATSERRARRTRIRHLSVRFRLIAAAVIAITALLVLVAFDSSSDWQQQTNLRNDSATGELGGEASLPLFSAAQAERRLSAVYLARPTAAAKEALDKQRTATDASATAFRRLSGSTLEVDHRRKWEYVERVYDHLSALEAIRGEVDDRTGNPDRSIGYYTDLLGKMIEFYQELSAMDDRDLAVETRSLVALFWASEGLSQEDMLVAATRASGMMSTAHRTMFAEAYGTQRVMYQRWVAPDLRAGERAMYDRIVGSDAWRTKERLEQAIIAAPTSNSAGSLSEPPAHLDEWDPAYQQITGEIAALNLARTQGLVEHGYDRSAQIRNAVYWKVGGSGAAVFAIGLLLIGLIVTVLRRTGEVRAGALTVAEDQLPQIVRDLQHGRSTDLSVLPPPQETAYDEFDQISNAIALLARQAAEAALTVYDERRGFEQFTAGVSTRAVVIVGRRMLTLLDELQERYGDDPELLGKLYELDHQSVRVRRLIENLLLLSGSELDHPHDRPVHVANLLMDSAGESSAFKRVVKDFRAEAWIQPHAAGELTHLLSELIDNAATFSPKEFEITVRSIQAAAGVAIEVEDRGHPLAAEQIAELNARLEEVPLYGTLAKASHQLGLFVVGQLAKRLGVTVTLRESAYRGVLATVLVPNELLTERPQPREQSAPQEPQPSGEPAPPETTHSGLVKRDPGRSADRKNPADARTPASPPAGGEAPAPAPAQPSTGLPAQAAAPRFRTAAPAGLPQRLPGTHLVEQLRDDDEPPSTTQRRHAVDTRTLDEIQDAFSALDEIRTLTPENHDEPQ
ncbi:nitrate- and nitrite sensing domain-containing protein [Streptomyces sp. NPDC088725]|uniref:sensor histidine kinase n=1 Tax=Streptomyces sp. NPDC088725 TaxID=3365873 RepID=UPI0037F6C79D